MPLQTGLYYVVIISLNVHISKYAKNYPGKATWHLLEIVIKAADAASALNAALTGLNFSQNFDEIERIHHWETHALHPNDDRLKNMSTADSNIRIILSAT